MNTITKSYRLHPGLRRNDELYYCLRGRDDEETKKAVIPRLACPSIAMAKAGPGNPEIIFYPRILNNFVSKEEILPCTG
jgi:hypothetical protein